MTDATNTIENTGTLEIPTWTFEGVAYPLFPYDRPCEIKLLNGTIHRFKLWTPAIEKKREDILKSIITTSPAVVNGENPMDIKTDFTRSLLYYYDLMIEEVGGVSLEGENLNGNFLKANKIVDGKQTRKGEPARVLDLISPAIRKAAAQRLYSGRIEVEKPETEDAPIGFDPFEEIKDIDLSKEVEKQEEGRTIYALTLDRTIIVRQDLGIEQLPSGAFTTPTHRMRYHFDDPDGEDFSKWEMKAQKGYALSLKGGGTRAETFFNLDTISAIFNKLIRKIEGASLNGAAIELPEDQNSEFRRAILAQVPLHTKKMTLVQVFKEANVLGNV